MAQAYDPFTYQPMMRYFYEGAHEGAVNQLAEWLRRAAPSAYENVRRSNPSLLDAARSVRSGVMGLSGLGSLAQTATDEATSPITQWGKDLMALAQSYMAYDAQRDILAINIARAEKGLPPINSASLAPQFNIGASPELQQLGMIAIGGLLIVGLASAFRKR